MSTSPSPEPQALVAEIRRRGHELGFQQIGITDTCLDAHALRLERWLALGRHGTMHWMARHGTKRHRPGELVPGTRSVICARMDYLPRNPAEDEADPPDPTRAVIARYALGRDYHKLMRRRLARLAAHIADRIGPFGHRVFTDSAPVLEKALAAKAGLGWIGKHTNLINERAGSWFFLGEIYTDLALPPDSAVTERCGTCRACLDVCPTQAIVAPWELDARRCISYLTIEHTGAIPVEFRAAIGNRIYGCDDCQTVCPWNRFARVTQETAFLPRGRLDGAMLAELFAWDEAKFLKRTEGSAIRRIGHARWLRNIAVALGNALPDPGAREALQARADHPDAMVREHVAWALTQTRNSVSR